MKEGFIKLTGEDDIFYDSIEKVYRYRMYCPECGKYSGCWCFDRLEEVEDASFSGLDHLCSYKCFLINYGELNNEEKILFGIDVDKNISDLTEDDAIKIVEVLIEDFDYDFIGGKACDTF